MTRHDEWTGRCLHPLDDDGPCFRHKLTSGSVFVRSDGLETSAIPPVGASSRPDPDRTPDPRSTVQMPATSGRIGS